MSDADALVRELLRQRPDVASSIEAARQLAAEMAASGLPLAIDEVLVRMGRLDESTRQAVHRILGWPGPQPVSFRPDEADRSAVQRAIVAGTIGPEGLEQLKAFQAWAAGRGLRIGLVDLLEGRGLLPAATPDRPAPAPAPAPILPAPSAPRSPPAPVAAAPPPPAPRPVPTPAPSRRRPADRQPSRNRTRQVARRPAKPAAGLVIGLSIAGGALLLGGLGLAIALVGGGEREPVPDAVERAPERAEPEPRRPPERDVEWVPDGPDETAELESGWRRLEAQVDFALGQGDPTDARREIALFEERLRTPSDRERFGPRLAALRQRIESASAPDRPEPRNDRPIGVQADLMEAQRRSNEAKRARRFEEAIQWASYIIERQPEYAPALLGRGMLRILAGQHYLALQDLDLAEAAYHRRPEICPPVTLPQIVNFKSQACTFLLEFEAARAHARRFKELEPGVGIGDYLLALTYRVEGRLDEAIAVLEEVVARSANSAMVIDLGLSYLEQGQRDKAIRFLASAQQDMPKPSERPMAAACKAWCYAFDGLPDAPDLATAIEILEREAPLEEARSPYVTYIHAAVRSLAGDHARALEIFSREPIGWEPIGATGYCYAVSARALGREEEARRIFERAYRLRPDLASRFRFSPEDLRTLEEAKENARELEGRDLAERESIAVARGSQLLHLAQIEAFEGAYRFEEAAAAYDAYSRQPGSDSVVRETKRAAARARTLEVVRSRIVAAATDGRLESIALSTAGATGGRIVGGDEREVEIRIGGGEARLGWAFLGLADFAALAEAVEPSSTEWLALASLCLDRSLEAEGMAALRRAYRDPSTRGEVDQLVASRRGIAIPEGGFVLHKGQFVSAAEKANLDAGLVLFRGQWVTAEDRERTLKGYQRVKGEWTRLTEKQLLARGWERVDDEWLTPEELAERKGLWKDARELETRHFILRSDRGQSFLEELATVLEAAWPEFERVFGGSPSSERRLVVLAFKDFEGYRAYCQQLGRSDVLGALGFAPSEEYTCCGYDRFGDVRMFLGTLVHEAAHLFFQVTFGQNVPSWLAEGMATYFEGFRRIGSRYEFDRPSDTRLSTLRSGLLEQEFDLENLLAGDAGQLIAASPDRAVEFYARCWGLFYFMARSVDPAVREIFEALLARARGPEPVDLLDLIGEARREAFEGALLKFLKHL